MMNNLRTILVTGASGGFGKLAAETLVRRGFRVFACFRDPQGRDASVVDNLARTARQTSGEFEAVAMDVTSDESVEAAAAFVRSRTGRLDVAVNNAGISAMGLNEGFTTAQALALFDVNALGVHRVNRAVLPLMKPHRSGLLVHVSTSLARMTMPCFGLYAASKAAMEAIAETYRYELSGLGIDSVILEPGPYPTNLGANALAAGDPVRLTEYGELAQLPQRMMEGLAAMFAGPNAPNPQDVPDAIVRLIETSPGERPLRTLLGSGSAALTELNALTERIQAALFTAQGMAAMLRVAR